MLLSDLKSQIGLLNFIIFLMFPIRSNMGDKKMTHVERKLSVREEPEINLISGYSVVLTFILSTVMS